MFPIIDISNKKTKYVSKSIAKVIDNRDPLKKGRIRVFHPLLGDTNWIPYLRTSFYFEVPKINDLIYIECDAGYTEYPIAFGLITKGTDDNPDIPEVFKRDVPTNKGLFSKDGHLIELDDGEASPTTEIGGSEQTDTKKGIRITTSGGHKIHLLDDGQDLRILIEDKNGNKIDMDSSSGNLVVNVEGEIQLNGDSGRVLTDETDPIVDTIFGTLHVGSSKVKAGS